MSDTSGSTVTRRIHHADNEFADRAGVSWVFSGASRPEVPSGPLAEFGLPYYSEASEAIREWIDFREWHGTCDARIGGGLVFLPETRASFKSFAMPAADLLTVAIRRAPWLDTALRIKGVVRNGRTAETIDVPVDGEVARVPVMEDATHLEMSIVAERGGLLDWHRESPENVEGIVRALTSGAGLVAESRQLGEMIDAGEGDRVEFKPFVGPRENSKWKEMLESVAAFANTVGGTLLIGVDDHGVVRGVRTDATKWAKGKHPPEDVAQAYARAVRREIGIAVAPVPVTSVRVVEFAGHEVIVVEVVDSAEKPHELIESREVFVRRGATDRRVSVEEFRTLVHARPRVAIDRFDPEV